MKLALTIFFTILISACSTKPPQRSDCWEENPLPNPKPAGWITTYRPVPCKAK